MNQIAIINLTSTGPHYIISRMKTRPKDLRTPAQRARDTASIVGSLVHEGYVPNAEDEVIHQQSLRGEISTEEAIALFRKRGLEAERQTVARSLETEHKTVARKR